MTLSVSLRSSAFAVVACLVVLVAASASSAAPLNDVSRLQSLREDARRDYGAILATLKSLDGASPSGATAEFVAAAWSRLAANADAAERVAQGLLSDQTDAATRSVVTEELSQIRRFHNLARQFLARNAPEVPLTTATSVAAAGSTTSAAAPSRAQPAIRGPRFTGQLRLQLGSSSFKGATESSQTAQDFGVTGRYRLSPLSSVSLDVGRKSTVKQSAYTLTRGRVGFDRTLSGGGTLNAFAGVAAYKDDVLERSKHNDMQFGGRVSYPLGQSARVLADGDFSARNYAVDGGNDYSGARLNGKIRLGSSAARIVDLGVSSRFQSSDISSLSFTRLAPHVNFRSGSGQQYFTARAEFENMSYAEDASSNDYSRIHGELAWVNRDARRSLAVVSKNYTNNTARSNIRFKGQLSKRTGRSSSRLAATFVYHTNADEGITNYLDVRSDIYANKSALFAESRLFGRAWMADGRAHRAEWSGALGFRVWKIKIGPSGGVKLNIDPNDFAFESDGNSWRAGGRVVGNFGIKRAVVALSARYEYTTAYRDVISIDRSTGLITRGALETRHPTTLAINGSVRVPVSRDFDVRVDVRQYDVNLDLDDTISINPISNRSQTQILAGLVYRIAR